MNTPTPPPPATPLTLADIVAAAVQEHFEQKAKEARVQFLKERIKEMQREIDKIEDPYAALRPSKWRVLLGRCIEDAVVQAERTQTESATPDPTTPVTP